jgi:hypothetical protein
VKREKLFTDGVPRFIRCYEEKRCRSADRFCVVYTHASWFDPAYRSRTVYRGMSDDPYHPLGIGYFCDAWRWEFRPCGSRITFHELPEPCQRLVISDYLDLWGVKDARIIGKDGRITVEI